jgi:uncharacterized membrane protein
MPYHTLDPNAAPAIAQATALLRAEHDNTTSTFQRAAGRITHLAGLPWFIAFLTIGILGWMGANIGAGMLGLPHPDPPPFVWLQGAISTGALYMAALILTTQRSQDRLATHRENLALELAIIADQKVAKIIELLEELRRDSPAIADRSDNMARTMAKPTDPQVVLQAIKTDGQETPPPE